VLVAVSGGKDSLAVWDLLVRLGYRADGLYIGLGIGAYSDTSAEHARRFATDRGLHLVEVDLPLILAASELEERHRLSFWDALVVEAARRSGATRLVTEDLQDGRTISGVRIENPFR